MELDVLLKSVLEDAKFLILNYGSNNFENLKVMLKNINIALKELDGADLIDLNKVWHQAKDVMPPRIYGGNHADLLCVHQFKPTSHPILTHEEYCPEEEAYLKASPNDWWCRTGDLLKKEHRELYWR